jgi:hypothetical protein
MTARRMARATLTPQNTPIQYIPKCNSNQTQKINKQKDHALIWQYFFFVYFL